MTASGHGPDTEELPDHAGVAFHPPFFLLGCLIAGSVLRWLIPLPFLPRGLALALGPVVTVLAFALSVWAFRTMQAGGGSVPTGEPTDVIVETGPYRRTRNPIYLGMLLLQLGIAIWANSLWFVLVAIVFVPVMVRGVISREERYLERKFGDDYRAYCGRVRRWV